MQITSNITPKFNNNLYKNNKQTNSAYNPQFTGVSQMYDTFCHGVGKHFSSKVFDNGLIKGIAYLIRDSENAVKHFLTVGSVITSGMYMKQTLSNKKMDKDRRQTLAVNQGFTLILATLGAYTLDSKLKSWWSKKHEQFMKLSDGGKAAWTGMENRNEKIKNANKKINEDLTQKIMSGELTPDFEIKDNKALNKYARKFINSDKSGTFADRLKNIGISVEDPKDSKALAKKVKEIISKEDPKMLDELKKVVRAEDYIRKLMDPTLNIDQYLEKYGKNHVFDNLEQLKVRSKGFAALRSILVFGFIYRFFVPLAVVKPTNWLCEKYLEHKKQVESQKLSQTA